MAFTAAYAPAARFAFERGARLAVAESVKPEAEGARPIIELSLDRDTDLFQADFTFYGFSIDKSSSPPALVVTATSDVDIWTGVVVQLPPQAIAEGDYAYQTTPTDLPFDPTPILSELSDPSHVAFTFEKGDRIDLPTMTAADLLVWDDWVLSVPETAIADSGASQPTDPSPFETAIESPFGLILAPVVPKPVKRGLPEFRTAFDARTVPFTHRGVTESWTAALTGSLRVPTADSGYQSSVAAVWARDYEAETSITFPPECYILYDAYQRPPPIPASQEKKA